MLLGDGGEVTDEKEDVSRKITEYFEGVYKKSGNEPVVENTWDIPPPRPT